jgi:hypothetical protein
MRVEAGDWNPSTPLLNIKPSCRTIMSKIRLIWLPFLITPASSSNIGWTARRSKNRSNVVSSLSMHAGRGSVSHKIKGTKIWIYLDFDLVGSCTVRSTVPYWWGYGTPGTK